MYQIQPAATPEKPFHTLNYQLLLLETFISISQTLNTADKISHSCSLTLLKSFKTGLWEERRTLKFWGVPLLPLPFKKHYNSKPEKKKKKAC